MYGISYIDFTRENAALKFDLRNHIRQHRARLDMTQQDLADRVDVRRQTILAIEKGRFVPSALLAFRIAGALGMRADELFELVSEEES